LALKITVLGKSPSWQDAGGACSGYLIETDATKVLLDCGNGVFGKLRERVDYTEVDAVVISHLHADHFLDLVPFSYALIYAPKQQPVPVHIWEGTDDPARPRMVAPPGAVETFRQVVGAWGNDDLIESAFRIEEYSAGDRGHLTPEEAGEHAKEAGAKRVVITHISDELGDEWAREEAERGFGGSVEIAHEWAEYEV
jgi:ribonuclease BN (tRNA processing enzyme)